MKLERAKQFIRKICRYPGEDRTAVIRTLDEQHFSRMLFLVPILTTFAIFFLGTDIYFIINRDADAAYPWYLPFDVIFLVLQTVYFAVVFRIRFSPRLTDRKIGRLAVFFYALICLLWADAISVAEYMYKGHFTTLLIAVMTVSIFSFFQFLTLLLLDLGAVTLFITAVVILNDGGTPNIEQITILVSLLALSLVFSRYLLVGTVENVLIREKLERLNEDLKTAQINLIRKEKMATVGQLSAGIAHEINNPLSFLKSNFSALEQGVGFIINIYRDVARDRTSEEILHGLDGLFKDTKEGFRRISEVIDNLLYFSHDSPGERILEDYDLNTGVESVLVITRHNHKGIVRIKKNLQPLPKIKAKAGEINQVLLNIFLNAVHAAAASSRDEEGVIGISTWFDNAFVLCDIANSGPEIEPAVRSKIFDPFFTTKGPGVGLGLGLSLSWEIIVARHKGSLELLPGLPTTFRISLPLDPEGTVTE